MNSRVVFWVANICIACALGGLALNAHRIDAKADQAAPSNDLASLDGCERIAVHDYLTSRPNAVISWRALATVRSACENQAKLAAFDNAATHSAQLEALSARNR
jgi:hypothetical protein